MKKLGKILDFFSNHSIFVYGTLATAELLYLLENRLKKQEEN